MRGSFHGRKQKRVSRVVRLEQVRGGKSRSPCGVIVRIRLVSGEPIVLIALPT